MACEVSISVERNTVLWKLWVAASVILWGKRPFYFYSVLCNDLFVMTDSVTLHREREKAMERHLPDVMKGLKEGAEEHRISMRDWVVTRLAEVAGVPSSSARVFLQRRGITGEMAQQGREMTMERHLPDVLREMKQTAMERGLPESTVRVEATIDRLARVAGVSYRAAKAFFRDKGLLEVR